MAIVGIPIIPQIIDVYEKALAMSLNKENAGMNSIKETINAFIISKKVKLIAFIISKINIIPPSVSSHYHYIFVKSI